jgi:hypothetical protein
VKERAILCSLKGPFVQGRFLRGQLYSGTFCPGTLYPGTFYPGTFCPATFCPGDILLCLCVVRLCARVCDQTKTKYFNSNSYSFPARRHRSRVLKICLVFVFGDSSASLSNAKCIIALATLITPLVITVTK